MFSRCKGLYILWATGHLNYDLGGHSGQCLVLLATGTALRSSDVYTFVTSKLKNQSAKSILKLLW